MIDHNDIEVKEKVSDFRFKGEYKGIPCEIILNEKNLKIEMIAINAYTIDGVWFEAREEE